MKALKIVVVVLASLAVLGLWAKYDAWQARQHPTEADPVKRGVIAMDAIYASETAFMQQGMPAIDTIVRELQTALAMWPQTGNGEGVDACRMALRLQTTRILNLTDHIATPKVAQESDFRQACRDAVSYQYDDARMRQVWATLIAQ